MATATASLESMTRPGLLLLAQRGDRESVGKLILPYAAGLYRGALRLTRNPADAEDVRQEAFLKVIRRLEQFAGSRSRDAKRDDLHAWVSRIGTNASIDVIRKRRDGRSAEHTSELQSQSNLVCRLLLENTEQPFTERRTVGYV